MLELACKRATACTTAAHPASLAWRQPMDFFGAVKSRMADGAVRRWLADAAAHGQVGGDRCRVLSLLPRSLAAPFSPPFA